jgi:hypothetical protein
MILKKMISKGGQEHVEMIIAFTIFISFVIFLFVLFNPFKPKPNEALVNNLYLNMKENMSVSLLTVSVKINDSGTDVSQCFKINISDLECKGEAKKIIVKDKAGVIARSNKSADGIISIQPGATSADNYFFTLYCSEELLEGTPFLQIDCAEFKKGENYTVGIIVTRNLWSENKSAKFESEYKNSYDKLKGRFVPPANDFKFAILNETQGIVYNGTKEIPRGVNVDSGTIPIDLLDSDAIIKKGSVNILVW